jgi:uncharacterized protein
MALLMSFVAGLVFGLGLIVAGMVDPARVLAFLDLAGRWDPSLALVIVGAIGVAAIGFAVARRRTVSWLRLPMRMPMQSRIDAKLVTGSLMFGAGWGLAGFCPGPALVALGAGQWKAAVFVLAMLAGMGIHELLVRRASSPDR